MVVSMVVNVVTNGSFICNLPFVMVNYIQVALMVMLVVDNYD